MPQITKGTIFFNKLCYKYLFALKAVVEKHRNELAALGICSTLLATGEYDSTHSYINDYRDVLLQLQKIATQSAEARTSTQSRALKELFLAIYDNNNQVLKDSYQWIASAVRGGKSSDIKKTIAAQSHDSEHADLALQCFIDPAKNEAALLKFNSLMGSLFQPMVLGSLPTVRTYDYKSDGALPKELRFGTQIEVVGGIVRINPLFEKYLAYREQDDQTGYHVYFNSLRYGNGNIEQRREGFFTAELHSLAQRYNKFTVITLPADGGLIHHKFIADDHRVLSIKPTLDEIRDMALNNGLDFFISANVREKTGLDAKKIEELLDASVTVMGLDKKEKISPAERHALMFHFVKYELTNFIINQLKADTVNFTCKDAIDRGGVHSLYFNLMSAINKSIESGAELKFSKEEFLEGLHAAPAMVKGRGMNKHADMIWNALDKYIAVNKDKANIPSWLQDWVKVNTPAKCLKTILHVGTRDGESYDYTARVTRVHKDLVNDASDGQDFKTFTAVMLEKFLSIFANLISYFANCSEQRQAALHTTQYGSSESQASVVAQTDKDGHHTVSVQP